MLIKLLETLKNDQTTLDKINEYANISGSSNQITTDDIDDIITKKLHKQDILTDRQFEVLSYLKLGYNTTEIAKELNVAVVTIHKIIKSMAKKIANYYKKLEG